MKETVEHVRGIDLDIKELESEEFAPILNRAEERVRKALLNLNAYAKAQPRDEPRENEIEIFSFPIAVMLVAATEDSLIKSRYSLAEAKRASELLKEEEKEKLLEVANNFNWDIRCNSSIFTDKFRHALSVGGNNCYLVLCHGIDDGNLHQR